MHSNFDFNAFSDRARPAIYTSRKDFHVYRLYRGRKSERRWHHGAEKSEKVKISGKVNFLGRERLNLLFQLIFNLYSHFQ